MREQRILFARKESFRSFRRTRSGVAAVEFAVCLPVIVLLVFGSIEASSMIFLKQSLSVAAYEGARHSTLKEGHASQATASVKGILDSRKVVDYAISFPNGSPETVDRGQEVSVEVTASSQSNSPLAGQFLTNRDLSVRVVMVKE